MRAITVLVPPDGVTLLLKVDPGAKSAEAIIVIPDGVDVSPQCPPVLKTPTAIAQPNTKAHDVQYVVDRLRKLKVRTEAAAINSIKAMFQFTEPLTDQDAKKRLTEAGRKGLLKIDAAGRIVFRDT